MTGRIQEIILKIIIVIGIVLLIAIMPGLIILSFCVSKEVLELLFNVFLFSFFGDAVLLIILWLLFGGIKQKPQQAEKIPMSFENYIQFKEHIDYVLGKNGYISNDMVLDDGNSEFAFYWKSNFFNEMDCFAILKTDELSNEILEYTDEMITSSINKHNRDGEFVTAVDIVLIACVNKINSTFQKMVNSNIYQQPKVHKLPVGVSFGGKKVYVAKQKDGLGLVRYKDLRKKMISLLETKP